MRLNRLVKLDNNKYYIVVDTVYKKSLVGIPNLCLENGSDDYFDCGDLSILIKKIEDNYTEEKSKDYDNKISYMGDILYIYDRIPFISGINNIYSSNNGEVIEVGFISTSEIDDYIKEFNVSMHNKDNFKLSNVKTWIE